MGQTFTLKSGDLKFTAVEQGEGPLVLCLHGFPDCYHSFRHQLPFLAAHGYRAVSVSLRGYGSSQPSNGDYSLESIANDIIAFIDQLGEDKAHLIGHDWGAAIMLTRRVPQHPSVSTAYDNGRASFWPLCERGVL